MIHKLQGSLIMPSVLGDEAILPASGNRPSQFGQLCQDHHTINTFVIMGSDSYGSSILQFTDFSRILWVGWLEVFGVVLAR